MADVGQDDIRRPPGIRKPEVTKGTNRIRIVVGIVVLLAVLLGFISCVTSIGRDDYSVGSYVPEKYLQTWEKSYGDTSCTEWNEEMTASQQFAASADMLAGARNKGDGGTGLPPDPLVDEFAGGISSACVIPTSPITEIAVGVYLTEPRFKP